MNGPARRFTQRKGRRDASKRANTRPVVFRKQVRRSGNGKSQIIPSCTFGRIERAAARYSFAFQRPTTS